MHNISPRSQSIAERFLCLGTDRQNASAIIGDLLEQGCSPTHVCWTVVRILLAGSWRWVAGTTLAYLSVFLIVSAWGSVVRRTWQSGTMPRPSWEPISFILALAAVSLSTGTALILCRFGLRNRLTWTSVALTASRWAVRA